MGGAEEASDDDGAQRRHHLIADPNEDLGCREKQGVPLDNARRREHSVRGHTRP